MNIVIIDNGLSNIGALTNMIKKIGLKSKVVGQRDEFGNPDAIIMPGVGAFDAAMEALDSAGLIEPLNDLVLDKKIPTLGICLGMQLFAGSSEEGEGLGLGWISGNVKRLVASNESVRIPHMGWNKIRHSKDNVFEGIDRNSRYYFVHSYHFDCENSDNELCHTNYEGFDFVSGVVQNNIYGFQFHPEKSHIFGLSLLKNFFKNKVN